MSAVWVEQKKFSPNPDERAFTASISFSLDSNFVLLSLLRVQFVLFQPAWPAFSPSLWSLPPSRGATIKSPQNLTSLKGGGVLTLKNWDIKQIGKSFKSFEDSPPKLQCSGHKMNRFFFLRYGPSGTFFFFLSFFKKAVFRGKSTAQYLQFPPPGKKNERGEVRKEVSTLAGCARARL